MAENAIFIDLGNFGLVGEIFNLAWEILIQKSESTGR